MPEPPWTKNDHQRFSPMLLVNISPVNISGPGLIWDISVLLSIELGYLPECHLIFQLSHALSCYSASVPQNHNGECHHAVTDTSGDCHEGFCVFLSFKEEPLHRPSCMGLSSSQTSHPLLLLSLFSQVICEHRPGSSPMDFDPHPNYTN